jgi:hypothetical protein
MPDYRAVFQLKMELEPHKQALTRLLSMAKGECTALHALMDVYEQEYYFQNSGDVSNRSKNPVRHTDVGEFVNEAVNILANSQLKIKVDRPGDYEPDKVMAGAIEDYDRKMLAGGGIRRGSDVRVAGFDMSLKLGMSLLHACYVPNPLAGLDHVLPPMNMPPVQWSVVDPRRTYFKMGGPIGWFEYVCHVERKTVQEAYMLLKTIMKTPGVSPVLEELFAREFADLDYAARAHASSSRDLVNYWGWQEVNGKFVVVNAIQYGEIVLRPFTVMEGYGLLPWAPVPSNETHHKDLAQRFLPAFYHALPHIRQAEAFEGRWNVMVDKIISMPYTYETSSESPVPNKVKSAEGYIAYLEPGQKLNPPPFVNLPADLQLQQQITASRVARNLFSPVGASGPATGYGAEQVQEGNKLKLGKLSHAMSDALEYMLYAAHYQIGYYKREEPVYATYVRTQVGAQPQKVILTGADLLGWTVEVEQLVEMPDEFFRRIAIAGTAKTQHVLPDEMIWADILRIDDPSRAKQLMQRQMAEGLPIVMEANALSALIEQGAIPQISQAQALNIQMMMQKAMGAAQANNAPPEVAMQVAHMVGQQELMKLAGGPLAMMMQGGGPPGVGGPPSGGDEQASAERRFSRDPSNGMVAPTRVGPPPGSPADGASGLRNTINNITPTR